MILLIDNYDSFVHNLARYLRRLGQAVEVVRNDAIDVPGVRRMNPSAIVLSPGPCTPREAGISLAVVRELCSEYPLLGVCLGHQAIAEGLGGRVVRAPAPVHGQASEVRHSGQGVFARIPDPVWVGRYHSLVVDESELPRDFVVSARTSDGIVMAIEHRSLPVVGVQFHPESVLTEWGYRMLANFLRIAQLPHAADEDLQVSESPAAAESAHFVPLTPVTF